MCDLAGGGEVPVIWRANIRRLTQRARSGAPEVLGRGEKIDEGTKALLLALPERCVRTRSERPARPGHYNGLAAIGRKLDRAVGTWSSDSTRSNWG
eukprot:scaffold51671_cov26-Tisochrysis_lutea.AAC.5